MFFIAKENMHPTAIATLMPLLRDVFPSVESWTMAATISAKP
jgi:hypothetical protein